MEEGVMRFLELLQTSVCGGAAGGGLGLSRHCSISLHNWEEKERGDA